MGDNVLMIKNAARVNGEEFWKMVRDWEDARFNTILGEFFTERGTTVLEFDSFDLMAITAKSKQMYHTEYFDYIRLCESVSFLMDEPFTCTIEQLPGENEGEFKYEMSNKVMLPPMSETAEQQSERNGKVIDLLQRYIGFGCNHNDLKKLIDELRAIYHGNVNQ